VNQSIEQSINERLNLLMELIGQINSTRDLNTLLASIMEAAKTIMEAEASSLMLVNDDGNSLTVTVPTGPATAEISGKQLPLDRGIGGWVASNNESVIVNDPQSDERFLGDITNQGFQTRNLVCVPLANREGDVLGVLQAINHTQGNAFQERELIMFQALAHQAAIAIEQARLMEEAIQKERYEQQLEMARSIQSGFWPKETPELDGYAIVGTSIPAYHVGGDYYDFIEIHNEPKMGLVVADVTGKGTPAALLMATTRAALRAQVENRHHPAETIQLVNKTLFKDTPIDKFVTLFYGELDTENDAFTFVNAGHNPPMLVDPNKDELTALNASGTMVGILESFPYEADTIPMSVGQKLVVYSDGITEAVSESGDMYGDERFESWLQEHAELSASQLMDALLQEINQFTGNAEQSDDITVIVLERTE
jgi:sigma-B regulation protein RsbU (phosphoserine phosphatase)